MVMCNKNLRKTVGKKEKCLEKQTYGKTYVAFTLKNVWSMCLCVCEVFQNVTTGSQVLNEASSSTLHVSVIFDFLRLSTLQDVDSTTFLNKFAQLCREEKLRLFKSP